MAQLSKKVTQCAECPYMLPRGFDACPLCPQMHPALKGELAEIEKIANDPNRCKHCGAGICDTLSLGNSACMECDGG